jgi:hypothetical protein
MDTNTNEPDKPKKLGRPPLPEDEVSIPRTIRAAKPVWENYEHLRAGMHNSTFLASLLDLKLAANRRTLP